MSENILIGYTKWLFKWIAFSVLGLVGVGLFVALIAWGWEWFNNDRHVGQIEAVTSNKVMSKDETRCSASLPIFIGYVNHSSKTIERISFEVESYKPGFSTNLLPTKYISYDRITAPGEGWGECWSLDVSQHTSDVLHIRDQGPWDTFKDANLIINFPDGTQVEFPASMTESEILETMRGEKGMKYNLNAQYVATVSTVTFKD